MAKRNITETWRGQCLDLLDPDGADIHFEDIAWALSRIARFNGHTQGVHPYSVAQHSVWCAWAAQHWFQATPDVALHMLMHDAHEAYTGDIIQPLKAELNVGWIEVRLQSAIYAALNLPPPDHYMALIRSCDQIALAVEAHHLMRSNGKGWWCMRDLPTDALLEFWSPLPAQDAYLLFSNAYGHLHNGLPLPAELSEVSA